MWNPEDVPEVVADAQAFLRHRTKVRREVTIPPRLVDPRREARKAVVRLPVAGKTIVDALTLAAIIFCVLVAGTEIAKLILF